MSSIDIGGLAGLVGGAGPPGAGAPAPDVPPPGLQHFAEQLLGHSFRLLRGTDVVDRAAEGGSGHTGGGGRAGVRLAERSRPDEASSRRYRAALSHSRFGQCSSQ